MVRVRMAIAMFAVVTLGACAQQTFVTEKPFEYNEPIVLLVRPDVTLAELSAGGVATPKADWTAAARGNIRESLKDVLETDGARIVLADNYNDDSDLPPNEVQLGKLHAAIGSSILHYQITEVNRLPTKATFDWSLGPSVSFYRDRYKADFALFVHIQDSYSSSERVAAQIMAAVLFGVALPGGIQQGFASLVDLRSGEIVWFNQLLRDHGDLRQLEPARETINILLRQFPGRPVQQAAQTYPS